MRRRDVLKSGIIGVSCSIPALSLAADTDLIDTLVIVVGIAAGGVSDTAARTIAAYAKGYAKSTIVENHTGAGGQIAASLVREKPADGTFGLMTPASVLTVYPHTYKKLPYDPFQDFLPVSLGGRFEFGLGVGPMVPDSVQSLQDFLAWCKENPDKASFGSPGAGSMPNFIGVLTGQAGGVELVHVPYRGSQPAIMDMIGGQIAAAVSPIGNFVQYVKAGTCRVLATSGEERSEFTPDTPTYVEQGYPNIVFDEWLGFFMPAKTPTEYIDGMSAAIRSAIAEPKVVETLGNMGIIAESSSPDELAQLLQRDHDRLGEVVKSIGFTSTSS